MQGLFDLIDSRWPEFAAAQEAYDERKARE
jgi:hypothetical protein